jgi:ABC-type multidrug transport system fused ATPase/permease subunit
MGAAGRVFELLDKRSDIKQPDLPIVLKYYRGSIRFEDVSFKYGRNNTPVLRNVNFEILPGESVALVGPSGSGKTTIIMLLLRFYDPDSGRILIDGHDLRSLDLGTYRAQLGVVFQDPFLFDARIRENISAGHSEMTEIQIMAAAKAANIADFIDSLPDGINTITGERGVALSGGQKQRLAIARALARNPRTVILDEATSALDHESENSVKKALHTLMKGRTSLVIAHRLSTVRDCSRILLLREGALAECSFSDLHAENGSDLALQHGINESDHL